MKIKIETLVNASLRKVWKAWNSPEAIRVWNTASEEWHTTSSQVDLRVGGAFRNRMEARDGSQAFDFTGVYTKIIEQQLIEYCLEDGRSVRIEFVESDDGVKVEESFDAEESNAPEVQQAGWQAILDNFKHYVESQL